jgi:hypothetical protein
MPALYPIALVAVSCIVALAALLVVWRPTSAPTVTLLVPADPEVPVDRRACRRRPRKGLAVTVKAGGRPFVGSVVDSSSMGIGLRLCCPVPVGVWVLLQPADASATGEWAVAEVRHCRPLRDGQWRAGVRVVGEVPAGARRLLA